VSDWCPTHTERPHASTHATYLGCLCRFCQLLRGGLCRLLYRLALLDCLQGELLESLVVCQGLPEQLRSAFGTGVIRGTGNVPHKATGKQDGLGPLCVPPPRAHAPRWPASWPLSGTRTLLRRVRGGGQMGARLAAQEGKTLGSLRALAQLDERSRTRARRPAAAARNLRPCSAPDTDTPEQRVADSEQTPGDPAAGAAARRQRQPATRCCLLAA
jgi:hypothetical protein